MSLRTVDDVVLLALSDNDFQDALGWFVVMAKVVATRLSTSMSEAMVLCWNMVGGSI